jgi:glycosyltransferase involved in cell wall biosynthesis
MRILQLCLSDGHGGLELYVARLCEQLRARGHECSAVVAADTMLARRLAEQDVPLTLWRVRARKLPLLAAKRLARHLERERIDIVHVNWAKDLPLAALAKGLCRRPVKLVHSRHMSITRPKRSPYHRWLYGALDKLIVLSELMQEEAGRYLPIPAAKIETLYLGVAASEAVSAPEAKEGPLRVGLFGRIEPEKGQHLLIEAAGLLRQRGVTVHARIIGHAMDQAYLAALKSKVAQQGLQNQVEFAGFHPAPQQIMPEFDVIVLATRRETFGLVLVEAMRCGVAVIGSNAGGVPEIIEHGKSGLLFEPGSAESLAYQLQALAEGPPARRRLAVAGRARANRMFAQEHHVAMLELLLRELTSGAD